MNWWERISLLAVKLVVGAIIFCLSVPLIYFYFNRPVSGMTLIAGSTVAGSADACASCPDAASGADLICEDFEGTGYLGSWTEDFDGASNPDAGNGQNSDDIDEDAAHENTLSCNDKGDQCLEIESDTTDHTMTYYDLGSGQAVVNVSVYFQVTYDELETGDSAYILMGSINAGTSQAFSVQVYRTSGGYVLRGGYREGSTSYSSSTTTRDNDTWYRLRIAYNKTAQTLDMYVDDENWISLSSLSLSRDPQYIILGTPVGQTSTVDDTVFQFDNLKIDDDTMPGACD